MSRIGRIAESIRGVREPLASSDAARQVQGYASATSVAPGERLALHVTAAASYRVTVRRWPSGAPVHTSESIPGRREADPHVDPDTGAAWCDWAPSHHLDIGADWPSGVYIARLTDTRRRWHEIPFVVRESQPQARILVVLPFATYAAYNRWPLVPGLGANLYHGLDPRGRTVVARRAGAVSLDRPLSGSGRPRHWQQDWHLVRWLHRTGRRAAFASGLDLETGAVELTDYQAVVFSGHDEYWSAPMRQKVEKAAAAGVSLAFFSANNIYWRIRGADGANGAPARMLHCDKSGNGVAPAAEEPVADPDATGRWRDLGEPEQVLLGAQFMAIPARPAPLVVDNAEHWFWAGTGARTGDRMRRLMAGEADALYPRYPAPDAAEGEYVRLAASPYRDEKGVDRVQHTTLYRTPAGGWIFNAGTFRWTFGLDRPGFRDRRVERATANLLDRMLADVPDRR